ncbi:MAG: hypothetical protein V2A70_06715 [Candidatus Omnitrophota bacterium]
MAEKQNNRVIEAGYMIENNGAERQVDQNVINDHNWIIVDEVMKMLKVKTIRSVQYYAKEGKWLKKFAKINNKERIFYSRKNVEALIKSRGPKEVFEEKEGEDEILASETAKTEASVHKPTDEKHHVSQETLPVALIKAGEAYPEIAKFVDFHMKLANENTELKTETLNTKAKLVFWKTSMFWLIGVSLVTVICLALFGFDNWGRVGELTKTKDELFTKTLSLQDEVIKTRSELSSKQAEIEKLHRSVNASN